MPDRWVLLISCEHAGYKIPKAYNGLIDTETQALLPTHRGWDQGALRLAKEVSRTENAPLFFTEISRLLIDCNRSIHHPAAFGPSFREASASLKEQIANDYYHPYRQSVMEAIERLHGRKMRVLHFAFHSFTPVLNGETRNAELGLLYDPARMSEKIWADTIMAKLKEGNFPWRSRRNYPYLGKSDGFTRFLRSRYDPETYAGFELEINQAVFANAEDSKRLGTLMVELFARLELARI